MTRIERSVMSEPIYDNGILFSVDGGIGGIIHGNERRPQTFWPIDTWWWWRQLMIPYW